MIWRCWSFLKFRNLSRYLGEEFKQLCRDFVTIETEHAEFMELKTNLEEAAEALGIENASLKEIRDAIQEKWVLIFKSFWSHRIEAII